MAGVKTVIGKALPDTTVEEITFRLSTLSDSNAFQKLYRQLISLRLVNGVMGDVKYQRVSGSSCMHGHPTPPPRGSMGNTLSGYDSILPNGFLHQSGCHV